MTTSVSPTGSTGPFVPLAQPGLTAPPRGATRSLPTAAAGLQAASSQTLATVTQVAKAARSSRSAGAADRLKQLLMMIKVLCLVGGDPKTVAHRAAQLAKEISAAAKTCTTAVDDSPAPTEGEGTASAGECDQAAGTPAAPPQVAADVNQAQATAQAAATAAGTTDCATPPSPGTPSPGASSPGPSSNADTDPTTAATTPKDGPNGGTGDTGAHADDQVITDPAAARRALVDQLIATGATFSPPSSDPGTGQTLFDQVKTALATLKGLVARLAVDAHDRKASLKAIREAEKNVADAANSISQPNDGAITSTAARAMDVMA